jgi:hypothetical protein
MLKNGAIWIVGLAIALASGLTAMGAISKDKAPELAVSVRPANGFAFERLATNSLKAAVAANEGRFPNSIDPVAEAFAKQAFLSEPVTPEAMAVLALGTTRGKKRELMHQAFGLSRRQQLVLGWMILDAGAREDIPAILSHYDTMLRTSSSAASVVISTMARALANKNFVEPFAELLSEKPPWASRFWEAVVATPEAIENAARLRERLYTETEEKESYRDSTLMKALVDNKRFEAAENLFDLLERPARTDSILQNSSFEREPKYPPLDWHLFSTGEYGAAITKSNLQLSAIRNSGGIFARQLVKLPPGTLSINVRLDDGAFEKGAELFISISCAELMEKPPVPIKIPLMGNVVRRQIANQQSGCSYFWFDIRGRSTENGSGFDVSIDSVSLLLE